MAGRRKTRKRNALVLVGDRIEDLTIQHYERAWELVQAKATPSQVLRLVPLTMPQLTHLWRNGLEGQKGRYPAQPSFELRIAEQLSALQSAAAEAAEEVSIKGVRVLSQTLDNAERANRIAEIMLTIQEDALAAELAKPVGQRNIEAALLGSSFNSLLRSLGKIADVRVPTMAYGKMFGVDLNQLVENGQLPGGVIDTDARERMPAIHAMRPEMGGTTGEGEFEDWTEEELAEFLETGAEPAGKG